ncbi:MAG: IS110 family transposase [Planctomycetota bacterium]|jgi:transposase|nr:IS110 family transposase [Planctomycetota bacterium]|tara:strand:+ start:2084 stop:3076 length:993 start_codon:yes stop_codon:yes gene_type:complete
MKQENLLGIDVSSKEVVVKIRRSGKSYPCATFENDVAGHKKLIRWATKGGKTARVCLEATGVYSFELALALHRHPHSKVMVINPRALRNFAQALMQRAKTDPIDAEVALEFLERMPFRAWQPPCDEILQLQAISRRICQLKMELNRAGNRKHACLQRPSVCRVVINDLDVHIRHLKRRVQQLEGEGLKLIQALPDLERQFQRLISVKGIATTSALRILAEIAVLPKDMQPEQWVAHAGLDPRPFESGETIKRHRYITKAGNKYLRAALFFPALVAIQQEANVKAFYARLIARGKKPMQAVVAVMRKLLRTIWGMLEYDQDFNGEKFYKMA